MMHYQFSHIDTKITKRTLCVLCGIYAAFKKDK